MKRVLVLINALALTFLSRYGFIEWQRSGQFSVICVPGAAVADRHGVDPFLFH